MARLLSPDDAARGADVRDIFGRTTSYDTGRDGITHVDNPDHVKTLRAVGWTPAGFGPAKADGYVCENCGFRAFFTTCSRCGGTCTRGT